MKMGVGIPELIIILLVVFLFIGPKKLPEAAESLGKALRSFKKAVNTDSVETAKDNSKEEQADKETPDNVQE